MPTTKTLQCSITVCILIRVIATCILIRVILMVSVTNPDTHSKYSPSPRTI